MKREKTVYEAAIDHGFHLEGRSKEIQLSIYQIYSLPKLPQAII